MKIGKVISANRQMDTIFIVQNFGVNNFHIVNINSLKKLLTTIPKN